MLRHFCLNTESKGWSRAKLQSKPVLRQKYVSHAHKLKVEIKNYFSVLSWLFNSTLQQVVTQWIAFLRSDCCIKNGRSVVGGELIYDLFEPSVSVSSSLEGGWMGWRDDTERNLWIRTMQGQLPLLIHLPYRHFLSFSTLTKLLVSGGGWQRIHIQNRRDWGWGWIHGDYGAICQSEGWTQTDT